MNVPSAHGVLWNLYVNFLSDNTAPVAFAIVNAIIQAFAPPKEQEQLARLTAPYRGALQVSLRRTPTYIALLDVFEGRSPLNKKRR